MRQMEAFPGVEVERFASKQRMLRAVLESRGSALHEQ